MMANEAGASIDGLHAVTEEVAHLDPGTFKTCPRCGQELFSDMNVCYGCLYDFTKRPIAESPLPEPDEAAYEDLDDPWDEPEQSGGSDHLQDTAKLLRIRSTPAFPGCLGLRIKTSDVDVCIPLTKDGLVIGRAPSCDVVLHSRAVSRRHVRITARGKTALVEDLGAYNPAMVRGRELTDPVEVSQGDLIDICGSLFCLVTGDDSSEPALSA